MMSGIRGKDTQPELVLRRGLFSRGVRFRLHAASLPGRPDIVTRRYRATVLVHGCFWHAHQGCRFFKVPDSNRAFWSEKLGRNRDRDERSVAALRNAGWRVAVVWECGIRADPGKTLDLLCGFLESGQEQTTIAADTSGTVSCVRK